MFKDGDIVRRVHPVPQHARPGMRVGGEYVVSCVGSNTTDWILVKECWGTWSSAGFELVRSASTVERQSRYLPDDTEKRKQYPLFDGLFGYFPNALKEVARWSVAGNNQHNPGQPLHWDMSKSTNHKDKILRHTLDAEEINSEGFHEAIGAAWRALALAEEILLKAGAKPGAQVKNNPYTSKEVTNGTR